METKSAFDLSAAIPRHFGMAAGKISEQLLNKLDQRFRNCLSNFASTQNNPELVIRSLGWHHVLEAAEHPENSACDRTDLARRTANGEHLGIAYWLKSLFGQDAQVQIDRPFDPQLPGQLRVGLSRSPTAEELDPIAAVVGKLCPAHLQWSSKNLFVTSSAVAQSVSEHERFPSSSEVDFPMSNYVQVCSGSSIKADDVQLCISRTLEQFYPANTPSDLCLAGPRAIDIATSKDELHIKYLCVRTTDGRTVKFHDEYLPVSQIAEHSVLPIFVSIVTRMRPLQDGSCVEVPCFELRLSYSPTANSLYLGQWSSSGLRSALMKADNFESQRELAQWRAAAASSLDQCSQRFQQCLEKLERTSTNQLAWMRMLVETAMNMNALREAIQQDLPQVYFDRLRLTQAAIERLAEQARGSSSGDLAKLMLEIASENASKLPADSCPYAVAENRLSWLSNWCTLFAQSLGLGDRLPAWLWYEDRLWKRSSNVELLTAERRNENHKSTIGSTYHLNLDLDRKKSLVMMTDNNQSRVGLGDIRCQWGGGEWLGSGFERVHVIANQKIGSAKLQLASNCRLSEAAIYCSS